jgi:hypothetical protein
MLGQTAVDYRSAKRRGELSLEKIEFLDSIGFPWEIKKPDNSDFYWENFLKELALYESTFGNLNVPNSYIAPSGYRLGIKVRNTRTLRKKGDLELSKFELLEKMGFPWGRKR